MLLALALAAAGPATATLAPVTKWVVEYDKDMCVLSRGDRQGERDVTLAFRPYPMGTETEIVLLVSGSASDIIRRKAHITLLPAGASTTGAFSRYAIAKPPRSLDRLTLGQDGLAGLNAAEAIEVRLDGAGEYSFSMPNIKAGLRVLAACQADMLKRWGIDPAEPDRVVTPPSGNPAAFFGPDAYPAAALQARQQGKATAVLMVAESGSPTMCTIVDSSGNADLDEVTCTILTRAKLKPGRNREGKPVAAHLVVPVRWILPN